MGSFGFRVYGRARSCHKEGLDTACMACILVSRAVQMVPNKPARPKVPSTLKIMVEFKGYAGCIALTLEAWYQGNRCG